MIVEFANDDAPAFRNFASESEARQEANVNAKSKDVRTVWIIRGKDARAVTDLNIIEEVPGGAPLWD